MAVGTIGIQESISVVYRGLTVHCSSDENQGDQLHPALYAPAGRGYLLWVLKPEAMDGLNPLPPYADYYSSLPLSGGIGGGRTLICPGYGCVQLAGLSLHPVSCHPELPAF